MKVGFKLVLMTLPFVALGVGFVAYTISTRPAPAQEEVGERAIAVRVITARSMAVSPRVTGFGLVAPARTYEAIAQVTGTAQYVNPLLKKGDILPEGAVLVRLSDADYRLAIARSRADIRAAEARLAEIEVSRSNLQAALEIEEESQALKARELGRVEKLFAAGTASQAALDGVRSAYLAQRQKVQSLKNSLALIPTQRQAQKEQISVHQAALEIGELNLQRTELRLPFTARVGAVSVEIGQLVRSGQTIAGFDGVDAAELEAQIPASDLLRLFRRQGGGSGVGVGVGVGTGAGGLTLDPSTLARVFSDMGIRARVKLKLGTDYVIWPAELDRISNSIDPRTGAVGVIVRVDKAYSGAQLGSRPPLTKGMFAQAVLEAAPVNGIVVARSALRGERIMIADSQNRLRLVPVTIAFVQDRIAVLVEGLEEGAQVIVSAPVPMIEGMLLDLHPDEQLMQQLYGRETGR